MRKGANSKVKTNTVLLSALWVLPCLSALAGEGGPQAGAGTEPSQAEAQRRKDADDLKKLSSAVSASPRETVVGWRYDGSGQFAAAEPVTEWSAKANVLWSIKAGPGNSSPIAVGGKVLLAVEPDLFICLDAANGKECWRKTHKFSDLPAELHAKDPELPSQAGYATPTPVSDGHWVYACFGSGIAACYDLEGKRRWIVWLDVEQTTGYGRTASPVLVGERLLLHLGPLVCLDAATGKRMWQNEQAQATYGTPAATCIGGVDIVVTPRGDIVRISDGRILADGVAAASYVSPVIAGGVAYFIANAATAIQLPDKITEKVEAKELWCEEIEGDFFASPVIHEGLIYIANADAVYHVLDAKTGKTVLKEALKLPPAGQHSATVLVYPSLALAGKHLFVGNNAGDTAVLKPGPKLEEVKLNSLSQGCGASYAFAGSSIFIRGGQWLYCIRRTE